MQKCLEFLHENVKFFTFLGNFCIYYAIVVIKTPKIGYIHLFLLVFVEFILMENREKFWYIEFLSKFWLEFLNTVPKSEMSQKNPSFFPVVRAVVQVEA